MRTFFALIKRSEVKLKLGNDLQFHHDSKNMMTVFSI